MSRVRPVASRQDAPIKCKPTRVGKDGKVQTSIPVRRVALFDRSHERYERVDGKLRRKSDYTKFVVPKHPTYWSSWL